MKIDDNYCLDESIVSYDGLSVLRQEVANRLLDRLELVRIQPEVIIEVGPRTDYVEQPLLQHYPDADIQPMALMPPSLLPDQSADLIIANLALHWVNDRMACLKAWRRLLKPGGLLLFTTLGPDTLYELRDSFRAVDPQPHVHFFFDMHDVGDAMLAAQFAEPVIQAEHLCFTYSNLADLFKELRDTRVVNALQSRSRGLYGKQRWQGMLNGYKQAFFSSEQGFPATFEIIYGLGWANTTPLNHHDQSDEITIPLSAVKRPA